MIKKLSLLFFILTINLPNTFLEKIASQNKGMKFPLGIAIAFPLLKNGYI